MSSGVKTVTGVFLILLVVVAAAIALLVRRRNALQTRRTLLSQVAFILGGQVRPGLREAGRSAVQFRHSGREYKLYEETVAKAAGLARRCVVETATPLDSEVHIVLERRSSISGSMSASEEGEAGAATSGDEASEPASTALTVLGDSPAAEQMRARLRNDDTQRLVSYALDRRTARLRLTPSGCWYECDGFSDNAELLAATARTGAEALNRLLPPLLGT